jgi:hypothetical protein
VHKSEEYGVFSIRDKDKISDEISDDFARVFSRFSPYDYDTVRLAFHELLEEGVIHIYRNKMIQKRMVKDNEISELRSKSGKKGGLKSLGKGKKNDVDFALNFAQAKTQANTEYENEYENEIIHTENEVIFSENFERTFLESKAWISSYSENNKIDQNTLKSRIAEFIKHLADQKKESKTYSELFVHFSNWDKFKNKYGGTQHQIQQTATRTFDA